VEFEHVHFSYPAADKVSLASLEDVAVLDTRGGEVPDDRADCCDLHALSA